MTTENTPAGVVVGFCFCLFVIVVFIFAVSHGCEEDKRADRCDFIGGKYLFSKGSSEGTCYEPKSLVRINISKRMER